MNAFLGSAVVVGLLVPVVALAQAAGLNPDDVTAFAKMFLEAVRGGNWMVAFLAGLIAVVWVVRKVLVRVPRVGAFIATDAGGALVNLCTLVPLALLGAHLAGQPMTWALALAAVGGPTALYVLARKLLVPLARWLAPLAYRIPYVGEAVAKLLDPAFVPPLKVVQG